jgi:hypothetical protein
MCPSKVDRLFAPAVRARQCRRRRMYRYCVARQVPHDPHLRSPLQRPARGLARCARDLAALVVNPRVSAGFCKRCWIRNKRPRTLPRRTRNSLKVCFYHARLLYFELCSSEFVCRWHRLRQPHRSAASSTFQRCSVHIVSHAFLLAHRPASAQLGSLYQSCCHSQPDGCGSLAWSPCAHDVLSDPQRSVLCLLVARSISPVQCSHECTTCPYQFECYFSEQHSCGFEIS